MTDAYVPEAGDIVWTDPHPRTAREQGGRRPVLVISEAGFFAASRFLIVCPISSKVRPFNSSVVLPDGFPFQGEILTAQVRSLDALARPIRSSGLKAPSDVLSEVRGKLAVLCGVTLSDLSPP